MTKKQYIELTNILEELEWDYGYGPSFEITEGSDIILLRQNIYEDFKTYKIDALLNLNESQEILGRLNAI